MIQGGSMMRQQCYIYETLQLNGWLPNGNDTMKIGGTVFDYMPQTSNNKPAFIKSIFRKKLNALNQTQLLV